MVILVVGPNKQYIGRAVDYLVSLERSKKLIDFKSIKEAVETTKDIPEIYNSVVVLDYPDILGSSKLLTCISIQSRPRRNTILIKALDWSIEDYPTPIRRLKWISDLHVTAGETQMVLWDRQVQKVLPYPAGGE